jgi:hypothetical protein
LIELNRFGLTDRLQICSKRLAPVSQLIRGTETVVQYLSDDCALQHVALRADNGNDGDASQADAEKERVSYSAPTLPGSGC